MPTLPLASQAIYEEMVQHVYSPVILVRDARKWMVYIERDASGFYAEYYVKLLEKAWQEVAFVFTRAENNGHFPEF